MATPTQAQATGEQRAATAVLAGPAFIPPTLGGIERHAGRLVDRVAPHGAEAVKSGPLSKLAWSDRLLGGYIGETPVGRTTGDASPVSWLFPTPRHHDEVGWLAASSGAGAGLPTALIAPSLAGADAFNPLRALGARAEILGMVAAFAAARTTAGMTRPWTSEYRGPLLSALPALSYLSPDALPAPRAARGAMPPVSRPAVELPRPTIAPPAAPLTEDAPPIAPRSERERAAELLSAQDAAPSLAAGPNLFLPAGLGGAVAPSAFADAAPLGPTAASVAALEAQPPAAIDRLAWADRWLARFAGASPAALAALDAASSVRPIDARADETPREAPTMVPLAAASARVEDDERVPDSVFAAIAAARGGRAPAALPRQTPAEPVAQTVERPVPPPAADSVLARPLARPDAGMQAALAASPTAPTLIGTVPMARGALAEPGARTLRPPTTDIRAISPAALVTMASQGGPIEQRPVAAPQLSWLSLPEPVPRSAARQEAGRATTPRGERLEAPARASEAEPAPRSARPGQLAAAADGFAEDRDPEIHGLSADYVPPELVLAARRFGFGPAEALTARAMADGGLGELALGASSVDRVLVAADDERTARGAAPRGEAAPATSAAQPARLPRGAFLWPDASARALGVKAEPAPQVGAALELMAAHAVAGAAIAGAAVLGEAEGGPGPAAWPEFQAIYLALGEEPEGRTLAPAARAARALALVQRSGPALGPTERARMAWAALPAGVGHERPVVAPTAQRSEARELPTAAGRSSGPREVFVAPAERAATREAAVATPANLNAGSVGEALNALVVPSRPSEPAARPSEPAPAPAVARQPPAAPAAPTGNPNDPMPAWMEEAARRIFAEGGGASGSGGMSVAEMVLVSAAPRSQMAASSVRPDAPAAPSAAAPAPGPGSVATPNSQMPKIDVDRLAQEVYELVCRMLDIARERSGDPWQRM